MFKSNILVACMVMLGVVSCKGPAHKSSEAPAASAVKPLPAEVAYVPGGDGRVDCLDAGTLKLFSSSRDFAHPDSIAVLSTGNAVLVSRASGEVMVCSPRMERVSSHVYAELTPPLVNAAALFNGTFIVADQTKMLVADEGQAQVIAVRDLTQPINPNGNLVVIRTIRRVDAGQSVGTARGGAGGYASRAGSAAQQGVWFGKVDLANGKWLPTELREDMPGATVSLPFVSGMWLVAGGGEMSVRGWGRGFSKRAVDSRKDEIIAAAAIPNRRFAAIDDRGEISVWKYSDDSLTRIVEPSAAYGKLVAIGTTENGDVIVGAADGTVMLLRLIWPAAEPAGAPAPPMNRPKPVLQVVAQRAGPGPVRGVAVGRTH